MTDKYNTKNLSGYHSVEQSQKKLHLYNKRHPREMGGKKIEEFFTHLAIEKNEHHHSPHTFLSPIKTSSD